MTDGILLQEARHDPWLEAYDVIMVDEAHERSLNIDFVLGLVYRAIARRRDLRVVVSSATLDAKIFQRFFAPLVPVVPRIFIEARAFPIRIHYQPPPSASFEALNEAVVETIMARAASGAAGHMLVFLAGEGNIQRIAEALAEANLGPSWKVMMLFGRLKRQEQEEIFLDFPGVQKVILSTNIAETSITVPGVRFVIDTGLAKVPCFHAKTGVTTLREEPISQAAANQRAGRAGRDGPGTVVRMWEESAQAARPAFTTEEIKRVDLSEAVLRLIDLGVRDVEAFALPTAPPASQLSEALTALMAMGAITEDRQLTEIGRQMVPYPLSPPLARMLVEAGMRAPEALADVAVIGAFLSVRAPFMTPTGQEWEARRAHRKLAHPLGDALTALAVFRAWHKNSDRARYCRLNYLDADTMAFIDRAQEQLLDIAASHGLSPPIGGEGEGEGRGGGAGRAHGAKPEAVLRCLAMGFASRVLRRRGPTYETVGGLRVALHPSSALFHDPPAYVVAAELMHARRLYGFFASALRAEWLADINPQAAAAWGTAAGPRRGGKGKDGRQPAAERLQVGGISLRLEGRRRPVVVITSEQVAPLLRADARPDAEAAALKARLTGPKGEVWLRGRLGDLLAALPSLPVTGPDAPVLKLPWGAVLEPDRNLHALLAGMRHLGRPAAMPGGGSPGWLTLAYNGGGGFWFQISYSFADCLDEAIEALDTLGHDLHVLGLDVGDDLAALSDATSRLPAARQRLGAAG